RPAHRPRITAPGRRAPRRPAHRQMICYHSRQHLSEEDEMSRAFAASLTLFAVLVLGASVDASAQAAPTGLVTTQKLSAALANELVGESVKACAQKGYTVTAVGGGLGGVRQGVLRGGGAPAHPRGTAFV